MKKKKIERATEKDFKKIKVLIKKLKKMELLRKRIEKKYNLK